MSQKTHMKMVVVEGYEKSELIERLTSWVERANMLPGLTVKLCRQVNEGSFFISIKDEYGRECFSHYMKAGEK